MEKITLSYEQLHKLIKKLLIYAGVSEYRIILVDYLINDKKFLSWLTDFIK
jgi:hypothetical protein